ncbi:MAG: DUF1640 domain-containing protein, partial [Thermus sp.]
AAINTGFNRMMLLFTALALLLSLLALLGR